MTNTEEARQGADLPGLTIPNNTQSSVAHPLTETQDVHNTPFRRSAMLYQAAGWVGTINLPMGKKFPPPSGYTGYEGIWPTDRDLASWTGNIGLRLPSNVIGIDIDHYGKKRGLDQLTEIEQRIGVELPPTWTSTRRGHDSESRIRFYRVPADRHWPTKASPDIDVIQYGHRYAVVWPSDIDEDGLQYYWYDPEGNQQSRPPHVDELAELPVEWADNPEEWSIHRAKSDEAVIGPDAGSWQERALAILGLGADDPYKGSNDWVFEVSSLLAPAVTAGVLDPKVAEAFAWVANLSAEQPHPISRFRETFSSAVKTDARNHPDRARSLELRRRAEASLFGPDTTGRVPDTGPDGPDDASTVPVAANTESVLDFSDDSGSLRDRTDGRHGYEALLKEAFLDNEGVQHKAEIRLFGDFQIRATAVCTTEGKTTWSVDIYHRDGTVYYDCQLPHDVLANSAKLKAWFMGYKCSLVYTDRYNTEKGSAGDRLMALFHSQNPTDYRITDHLGWDGEANVFVADSGVITPGSPNVERFGAVRPTEKAIEHSRSRYGSTVSIPESINVFRQILTHHDETVASVVGSWAVLAVLRSEIDPQVFPTLVAGGVAESGKTKFLQQVFSAVGMSGTGGSWTAATARRALGANSSGVVWFDDCDDIKSDIQQLLRQAATGGDTANMSAGDSTALEVTQLRASVAISSEGLGTFFKAQKANRDRMIEVHFPDPKGRMSVKDPSRPQWDDIVELWQNRFNGDFTQIAAPLVSAIFARVGLIDKFKTMSDNSSRRSQTHSMLTLGARLLADLTGDEFHVERVTAWLDEQDDLGNASVTVLQIIPTLWRKDGMPETVKDALGRWTNPKWPYSVYWDNEDECFYVSSAKLADAWKEECKGQHNSRVESLTSEEAIRHELNGINCPQGEPKRLGGVRLRYRRIPSQFAELIKNRAMGA